MFRSHYLGLITLCCSLISAPLAHAEENVAKKVENDFRAVAKKAIPAVVFIKVKSFGKSTQDLQDPLNFFNDDLFQFFGIPKESSRTPQVGQASGFIVSKDGYILTNSHVVKDASEITVALNDGREFAGKVIGQDPNTDIALVKIEAQDLPFIPLGNSDLLEVGQWVVAIGNPLGLQASLTVGVVSAKGRNNLDLVRIEDFIQTDAAINRGNSGGPLLNLDGEVIGINTAIVSNMGLGGYMGIGFAIPSNMAKNDMEQILENGSISRGYIGVVLQQIDHDMAQALSLPKAEGALIAEISPNSPAERAGLKQGDVILKYNEQPVSNIAMLRNAISLMKPGTEVRLLVIRSDKSQVTIPLSVAAFPSSELASAEKQENKLGIEVQALTPEQARSMGVESPQGVIVSNVQAGSVASWAGIKKGALILSVNQQKIASVGDFYKYLKETDPAKPVLLLVKQGHSMRFISLKTN